MAYDQKLAERIRQILAGRHGLNEREMFGGIGFTIDGTLVAGVRGDELIARVPADEHDAALKHPGARVFDVTGRPMKGWLLIGPEGTKGSGLKKWVERTVTHAGSLPVKKPKKPSGARRAKR